ncbi:hypothetical protein RAS_14030 [Rickettsia asiatica]|uniref:Uncharacterized protein n=1 Tax=Rickettsia asiatica TaxID=238800 RepID=A0A510GBK1_9RICK|nr:hypothetical protein [Rickettsia asiatica]BBJ32294.1 hypothetical protein RAS_14030 [Rickettsia asiatica]
MLTFNGTGRPYTFASSVANAGSAILNVDTDLTVTNQTIGTIKTINIGTLGTSSRFNYSSKSSCFRFTCRRE